MKDNNIKEREGNMQMKKKQAGVTLIALAITVIVIIILAGVSTSAIKDKKGTIKQAKESSATAERESIIEKIEADLYNEKIKTGKKPTKVELKKIIEEKGYSESIAEDNFISKNGNYTIDYNEIIGWEDI